MHMIDMLNNFVLWDEFHTAMGNMGPDCPQHIMMEISEHFSEAQKEFARAVIDVLQQGIVNERNNPTFEEDRVTDTAWDILRWVQEGYDKRDLS
jgi:hypothetical protein